VEDLWELYSKHNSSLTAASVFEQVVLTGAQMSGDVARQPHCGRVELGWGRQMKGGDSPAGTLPHFRPPLSLPSSLLRLSFMTWPSCAAGLSSGSIGEEGGTVLTLRPGRVVSGRDV
jgi:hypothetical protein